MLASLCLLLSAAVAVTASPEVVGIEKRSIGPGFAIQTTNCPVGTSACQSHWCCPDVLTCSVTNDTTTDNVCCNGSDDCFNSLTVSPACADSSWGLFLATITAPFSADPNVATTAGQLCCLPGQIGTINSECLDPAAVLPGQAAKSLTPGSMPTQPASSGSAGSTNTAAATATTATGGSSTTTSISVTITTAASKNQGITTVPVSLSSLFLVALATIFGVICA